MKRRTVKKPTAEKQAAAENQAFERTSLIKQTVKKHAFERTSLEKQTAEKHAFERTSLEKQTAEKQAAAEKCRSAHNESAHNEKDI